MKKWMLGVVLLVTTHFYAYAVEGMWLPIFLKQLNEPEMKAMGMRITAEDLYAVNKASLKDAVFLFGGGCTSEMVSSQGLLLTNHHCGYGQIQMHSSLENNYLKNGFWAKSLADELPNKGLTATRIVRIEDVTNAVLAGAVKESGAYDKNIIQANIQRIVKEVVMGTHYEAQIKPFYYGNEYYLFVTETFKDVRLVGAPPSYVGKFGGDTDNWMWPRHTGDYAVFRVYADANNRPAEYSPNNKPYQPLHFFPISMKGVKEGDFTMVYGFPGRTQEYLPSDAVRFTMESLNPARIQMRAASLSVIDKAMLSSELIKIQYAAKQSRISNAYKKWIGEQRGLKKLNAVAVKQLLEKQMPAMGENKAWGEYFANVFTEFSDVALAAELYNELLFAGPELFRLSRTFVTLVDESDSLIKNNLWTNRVTTLKNGGVDYFKNYNVSVDKDIMIKVFPIFFKLMPSKYMPAKFSGEYQKYKANVGLWAAAVYAQTALADADKLNALLALPAKKVVSTLQKDPVVALMRDFMSQYQKAVLPLYSQYNDVMASAMFYFMQAQRTAFPQKRFYPDANSTLRVSYGKVEGYLPADGLAYNSVTTLEGILQKYIPGDSEFDLGSEFLARVNANDFAPYGVDRNMPVAFVASNHTTGGNSGSPVLNADGHLIGINFDRTWESTMSDLMYDPERCRNIAVDIRYVLWTIHKLGGAEHLIKELNLVY